jgi:hypothetical protein
MCWRAAKRPRDILLVHELTWNSPGEIFVFRSRIRAASYLGLLVGVKQDLQRGSYPV